MTGGGSGGGTARGHFGAVADSYATFRPRYPAALYEHVASLAPRRGLAWDCGAGSGQASVDLAEWFERVVASDVSEPQLARAPRTAKILGYVGRAEESAIATGIVDLIVVAQALHWFRHDAFYAEVRRVAAPGAVIAVWSYGPVWVEGAVSTALTRFQDQVVGAYWPPERRYVDEGYRTIPFPFEELATPRLNLEARWTLHDLLGYVRSWSATARYMEARFTDPVVELARAMESFWPEPDEPRRVVWPLAIRIGRVRGA